MSTLPLDASTWPEFAALVERHNGVWGGCECMGFHPESFLGSREANHVAKERRVRAGAVHAALEAIAQAGGGRVEAYPEAFNGREASKSLPFMASGPIALFERHGFQRSRPRGKHHWVVEKVVAPSGLAPIPFT